MNEEAETKAENRTKLIVGTCLVLVIGSIFWLGAAYQRFSGMEGQLVSINGQMVQLVQGQFEVKDAIRRTDNLEVRIEKLENSVRQLK
jgi:hypothetical protein